MLHALPLAQFPKLGDRRYDKGKYHAENQHNPAGQTLTKKFGTKACLISGLDSEHPSSVTRKAAPSEHSDLEPQASPRRRTTNSAEALLVTPSRDLATRF